MKVIRPFSFLVLALIGIGGITNAQAAGLELNVQVHGGNEHVGQVIVSLFSSAENFLNDPFIQQRRPIENAGSATILFEGLAEGEYAVAVIYDEDGDGELNTGLFGIPSEKVGFSNDAKGLFGPPSFTKAAFNLLTSTTIVVNLDDAKK